MGEPGKQSAKSSSDLSNLYHANLLSNRLGPLGAQNPNEDIGHPKLFMVGKAAQRISLPQPTVNNFAAAATK
jgi:hypothetical protein